MSTPMVDPASRNVMATDILFNIFSKFSFEQKIKTAQVCQIWKDVVYHKTMWRNIKIQIDDYIEENNADTILPNLVKRNISSVMCSVASERDIEVLNKFMKEATNLKAIEFCTDKGRDEDLSDLIMFDMPNLIEVQIKGYRLLESVENCVARCKNIQSLTLGLHYFGHIPMPNADSMMRNIATKLEKLHSLRVHNFHRLTDVGIGHLSGCIASATHSQLETLMLKMSNITDRGLQYIGSGFHSLTRLSLSSDNITNKGVGYIGNIKCLRELGLCSCDNVNRECLKLLSNAGSRLSCLMIDSNRFDDKALEYIGESQLPLEELDVSWWNITTEGLRHLVKHNQSIKHLRLNNCFYITDKSLELIAEKFTSLRHLTVLCKNVTRHGIEKIRASRRNVNVTSRYS